ncbi:MAG: hypothetical protein DMG30_24490 [Acidobacteria bacterium]|nr:MAG: hypothetical protein DMG30_24490 [Acidobacteriota bacterium]
MKRVHVFRLTAPTEDEIRHFILKQRESSFSYPEVGASANPDNSRKLNTKSLFHGKKPLSTRLWYQEEAFV